MNLQRTVRGDEMLVKLVADPEHPDVKEFLADYRLKLPELAHLSDDAIVQRVIAFLAHLPRVAKAS